MVGIILVTLVVLTSRTDICTLYQVSIMEMFYFFIMELFVFFNMEMLFCSS